MPLLYAIDFVQFVYFAIMLICKNSVYKKIIFFFNLFIFIMLIIPNFFYPSTSTSIIVFLCYVILLLISVLSAYYLIYKFVISFCMYSFLLFFVCHQMHLEKFSGPGEVSFYV